MYINAYNNFVRGKLFGWLRTAMAIMESNDEDSLEILKVLIISNLNTLLNLNIDLTRDLVIFRNI